MATAAPEKSKPLLPPDEKFWQRYSPRREFPLAGMTSFFLHGLAIGILILAAFLLMLRRESENNKPPRMDGVILDTAGDGLEGAGAAPGLKGDGTEVTAKQKEPEVTENLPDSKNKLLDVPSPELEVLSPVILPPETSGDILADLATIGKEADKHTKEEAKTPQIKMPTSAKGEGGKGGSGGGPGKGTKGSGPGSGGGVGRQLTRVEIFARRWRFALSGEGKEHADIWNSVGVTLGFFDPQRKFLIVKDLSQRPVHTKADNPQNYFGVVVMWENHKADSVTKLAKELKLPFIPTQVFMMLPQDREQLMADVEADYARKQGRNPARIEATWFDFRLRGGVYEPVVIRQQ
jgi:hypothetical protein